MGALYFPCTRLVQLNFELISVYLSQKTKLYVFSCTEIGRWMRISVVDDIIIY